MVLLSQFSTFFLTPICSFPPSTCHDKERSATAKKTISTRKCISVRFGPGDTTAHAQSQHTRARGEKLSSSFIIIISVILWLFESTWLCKSVIFMLIIFFVFFLRTKPKSEMTEEELQKKEEEEFNIGPLSLLTQSVKYNTQVRNKMLASEENVFRNG